MGERNRRTVDSLGLQAISGLQRERLLGYVIAANCAVVGSIVGALVWGKVSDPTLVWPLSALAATSMASNLGLLNLAFRTKNSGSRSEL